MAKRSKLSNEAWDLVVDLFENRRRTAVLETAKKHV